MRAASMSRQTIAPYLGLNLKNRRKRELMQQRVNEFQIIQPNTNFTIIIFINVTLFS